MSNLDAWKAAKVAWETAEREYSDARRVVIKLGYERSNAWETVVQAARKLSPDEKKQAVEHQFGPSLSSTELSREP